jgi:tetratricopeptide (TPR) repeat protein
MKKWVLLGIGILLLSGTIAGAQPKVNAVEIFNKPGAVSARDLYKMAYEAFQAGDLTGARLLALRVFFDGHRSSNLLDLLGAIEVKADRALLGGVWLRKALSLAPDDSTAKKMLARLPPQPRPIPMESTKLADHFAAISRKLPPLLARLTNARLHADSILSELERGQFYKALALAEEYEKRYPGPDGQALTALCAVFLGRTRDASGILEHALPKAPTNATLLFVKAMLTDTHPDTSSPSRAKSLFDQDQWAEAEKVADSLTQTQPRSAEGLLVKARIAFEQLQIASAAALLEAVGKRDPDNPVMELLRAEMYLLTQKTAQAGDQFQRAFKRGYHLPSINLRAGRVAVQNDNLEEGRTILAECENYLPFLDRDAYSLFVRLAIDLGNLPLARKVMDEWQARFSPKSELAYCEALYFIRSGDGNKSLEWARKAFELNPNRLPLLLEVGANPIFDGDPLLRENIEKRIKKAGPLTAAPPPPPAKRAKPAVALPANPNAPAPTPPAAPTGTDDSAKAPAPPEAPAVAGSMIATGERFSLRADNDVLPPTQEIIKKGIEPALDKVEAFLGRRAPGTVSFHAKSDIRRFFWVAQGDLKNGSVAISGMFGEPGSLRIALEAIRQDMQPEYEARFLEVFPAQNLIEETFAAVLFQLIKNLSKTVPQALWLHKGLGQIAGNDPDILRDRLSFTQSMIAEGRLTLLTPDKVNAILLEPATGADLLNATTHAYLMTAFLIKKGATFREGINKAVQLLELLAAGKSMAAGLKQVYAISEAEFESGWKEAGYMSLTQGIPYEFF